MHYSISDETICAIITPQGSGAVATIRLSGKNALSIGDKIFARKKISEQQTHTVHFGELKDNNRLIDEVLVAIFKSPKSYTGEDVIEISGLGSLYIQQQILELLIKNGARLAKNGEFTLRAFSNGKLDLSQAEAVSDLIASESETGHKVALHQMRGGFSSDIKKLRDQLIEFTSLIELELDFSEEDVEFADRTKLLKLIKTIQTKISSLIHSFQLGNVIKKGIPVVIAGKPNVGKSTLLNALLNEDKAIVSHIPGTTRDVIEDEIAIGGYSFRFIDTAGLRETEDYVEAIGVKKTLEKVKSSSVIIYMFDVHETSLRDLKKNIEEFNEKLEGISSKLIIVGNKIDAENQALIKKEFSKLKDVILISAKEGLYLDKLVQKLLTEIEKDKLNLNETIITNSRHLEALNQTNECIDKIIEGLNTNLSGDLLTVDIKNALHHLGTISGEVTNEDILGSIFSRFCIGK